MNIKLKIKLAFKSFFTKNVLEKDKPRIFKPLNHFYKKNVSKKINIYNDTDIYKYKCILAYLLLQYLCC